MIPILYDKTETAFRSNGLGRLRDCITCIVTEERNGIYECDFEYPVTGANYAAIQLGRIIGVTHDDTGDVQPFDIVSFTRPINGVVQFHAVHISYRQSYLTVAGSNISGINNAFALLGQAQPSNPFSYESDITSNAYVAAADGEPRTVRSMLGGVEGSILDAFGGEYEFDRFNVRLYKNRGVVRDFTIRYGVNMLDYSDDTSSAGTYSAVVPFYKRTDNTFIIGDRQSSGQTVTGRGETIPLDVSDKFENTPTKAEVEAMGLSILEDGEQNLPTQTINVSFVRLQDAAEYEGLSALLKCKLCDSIKVIFPRYNTTGTFKIVKTTWDVLAGRYESMELGTLSTTLSEALGLSNGRESGNSSNDEGVITINTNVTTTTGTYVTSVCHRTGNVCELFLTVQNSATVAAGGNVWQGTFTDTLPRPVTWTTTGSYFGARSIAGGLGIDRSCIVRNASANTVTISGSNTTTVTFTYITQD